jgi:hypothetical protein
MPKLFILRANKVVPRQMFRQSHSGLSCGEDMEMHLPEGDFARHDYQVSS